MNFTSTQWPGHLILQYIGKYDFFMQLNYIVFKPHEFLDIINFDLYEEAFIGFEFFVDTT